MASPTSDFLLLAGGIPVGDIDSYGPSRIRFLFCLPTRSGFSQGFVNLGRKFTPASLSTSILAFSPLSASSDTRWAAEPAGNISPSFSFFCTSASSSCCLSGGRPMNKSPKFSSDMEVNADLSILAKASSRVRPLNKH